MSQLKGRPEQSPTNREPFLQSGGSRKRKINTQPKFYAVKVGHTPGVYLTWRECEENITKFKNALFKTFPTRGEADAFVAGYASITPVSEVDKYYGVAVGRKPGVYTDWATAQEQIKGWKGPKYRKFSTRTEAEEFVRDGYVASRSTPKGKTTAEMIPTPEQPFQFTQNMDDLQYETIQDAELFQDEIECIPAAKKPKPWIPRDEQPHRPMEQDVIEPTFSTSNLSMTNPNGQRSIVTVYTDGSSLGNGKRGAKAGVGVFFGNNDPRNISEKLQGDVQTNQRAELTAVLRALEVAPTDQEVHVYTDSRYSIDCVTLWYKNWERNQWQTSLKKPVLNKDLVQSILVKIRERDLAGSKTRFNWIKGHSNDPSNEAADRLAVYGAQMT